MFHTRKIQMYSTRKILLKDLFTSCALASFNMYVHLYVHTQSSTFEAVNIGTYMTYET